MTIVDHTKSMMAWIVPGLDTEGQAMFHSIETTGDVARFARAYKDKLGENNLMVIAQALSYALDMPGRKTLVGVC